MVVGSRCAASAMGTLIVFVNAGIENTKLQNAFRCSFGKFVIDCWSSEGVLVFIGVVICTP